MEKSGKTFGPEKYASATGVRERTIFRLLLLRCFLREDSDGRIVAARVDVTLPLARVGCGDPFKETREILDLLGKLGSIESLRVENSLPRSDITVDDSVVELFASLRNLRDLHLSRFLLTENGWKHVAALSQLRELHLLEGMSDDRVRQLRKSLPNCTIDGWP